MKRIALLIATPIMLLICFVLIYLLVVFGLLLFPANTNQVNSQAPSDTSIIDAYITSNGVHTDFVFPTRTPQIDWTTIFPIHDFPDSHLGTDFVAIGWGDREFYLNTPEWKDLTFKRAMVALSGQDQSLVHVEYLSNGEFQSMARIQTYHLRLTPNQYAQLLNYVLKTVPLDKNTAQNIPNYHYDQNDAFFIANGRYSMLKTCNTWIGNGLRQAGLKVSLWTPFDMMVYWYLEPVRITQ